jgi:hypothetical protein
VQHARHESDGRLHLDLTINGVRRHVPSWAGLVAPDLADDLARRLAHSAVDVVVAPKEGEPVLDEDGLGWLVPFRGWDSSEGGGDA